MVSIVEQKVLVGKNYINFAISKLTNRKPEKTLFLIPGGLETASSAFQPQLENLPNLLPNYQFVSFDPPGTGKSRPPNRRKFIKDGKIVDDRQLKDAENVLGILKHLKVEKFSILGWSFGGTIAINIASQNPNRVEKLVLVTTMAYTNENLIQRLELTRDFSLWPEEMRKPYVELYGFEEFKEAWAELVDYFQESRKIITHENQLEIVRKIQAPTLIFHGERDFYINDDASNFLKDNIKNSRMVVYKGAKGTHNLHLKCPEEFNQQLADFLNEKSKL